MTQRINIRLMGLLALSVALAAPAVFAQTPASQPASPAPQSDTVPTWAELDTNKDGNLNKTEAMALPSLHAVFDQADANADGLLTEEEYNKHLTIHSTQTHTED